eukprot:gene3014-13035_t
MITRLQASSPPTPGAHLHNSHDEMMGPHDHLPLPSDWRVALRTVSRETLSAIAAAFVECVADGSAELQLHEKHHGDYPVAPNSACHPHTLAQRPQPTHTPVPTHLPGPGPAPTPSHNYSPGPQAPPLDSPYPNPNSLAVHTATTCQLCLSDTSLPLHPPPADMELDPGIEDRGNGAEGCEEFELVKWLPCFGSGPASHCSSRGRDREATSHPHATSHPNAASYPYPRGVGSMHGEVVVNTHVQHDVLSMKGAQKVAVGMHGQHDVFAPLRSKIVEAKDRVAAMAATDAKKSESHATMMVKRYLSDALDLSRHVQEPPPLLPASFMDGEIPAPMPATPPHQQHQAKPHPWACQTSSPAAPSHATAAPSHATAGPSHATAAPSHATAAPSHITAASSHEALTPRIQGKQTDYGIGINCPPALLHTPPYPTLPTHAPHPIHPSLGPNGRPLLPPGAQLGPVLLPAGDLLVLGRRSSKSSGVNSGRFRRSTASVDITQVEGMGDWSSYDSDCTHTDSFMSDPLGVLDNCRIHPERASSGVSNPLAASRTSLRTSMDYLHSIPGIAGSAGSRGSRRSSRRSSHRSHRQGSCSSMTSGYDSVWTRTDSFASENIGGCVIIPVDLSQDPPWPPLIPPVDLSQDPPWPPLTPPVDLSQDLGCKVDGGQGSGLVDGDQGSTGASERDGPDSPCLDTPQLPVQRPPRMPSSPGWTPAKAQLSSSSAGWNADSKEDRGLSSDYDSDYESSASSLYNSEVDSRITPSPPVSPQDDDYGGHPPSPWDATLADNPPADRSPFQAAAQLLGESGITEQHRRSGYEEAARRELQSSRGRVAQASFNSFM